MTTKTKRLKAELQALLGPVHDDDLAERLASAELAAQACVWTLRGKFDPAAVESIAQRLHELPDDARVRVLAEAPENLLASPQYLPARLKGLRLGLAAVEGLKRAPAHA